MHALPDAILLPVAGHLILLAVLFAIVSFTRMTSVLNGERAMEDFAHKGRDGDRSRRWTNNLNNQFELPLLFYVLLAFLYSTQSVSWPQVWLAWLFLAGRVLHTLVQGFTDIVPLRGAVFCINGGALFFMWALFLADRWGWS